MYFLLEKGRLEEIRLSAQEIKSGSADLEIKKIENICDKIILKAKRNVSEGLYELFNQLDHNLIISTHFLEKKKIYKNKENSSISFAQLFKRKLLLVTDDPNTRLTILKSFQSSGFLVKDVNSDEMALEMAKKDPSDIIILDLKHNQLQLCQRLREINNLSETAIILTLDNENIEAIDSAFDAGASYFIFKPINHIVLLNQVRFLYRACQQSHKNQLLTLKLSSAKNISKVSFWTWYAKENIFDLRDCFVSFKIKGLETSIGTLENYLELVHFSERKKVEQVIKSVSQGNIVETIEYRLQVSNKNYISLRQEIAINKANSVLKVIGTIQDITQEKESNKLIYQLAYFDKLTGLASRTYFHKRFDALIKFAKNNKKQFAFLSINIDSFKDINDKYGYKFGDKYLKKIAKRIGKVARDIGLTARLGGNEFCIFVDDITDEYDAAVVAENCLKKVSKKLELRGHIIFPHVNIGIAIYPKDGDSKSQIMKAADLARNSIKNVKDQDYAYYLTKMAEVVKRYSDEENLLKRALSKEQFILYYQPKISVKTGKVMGFEALIRWQHPERGLLLPLEFIPLAEKIGFIEEIDNWVLKTACQQMMQWHKEGLPLLIISINISPIHFQNARLLDTISRVIKETGLPVNKIELEITESVMQTGGSLEIFHQLKKIGIYLALDDFGTGFSSLSSLKKLPIDCLKIDKLFIDDIESSTESSTLFGTIIGLAKALKHTIVAEGIERVEQALIVKGLGCEIVQGFYYSRPLPADNIPQVIDTNFI